MEKPGGRSIDATGSGARPAPVASRISPLAPLGRNDGWGCASVEMTVGCCASLESATHNRCPLSRHSDPPPSFRPEPRPLGRGGVACPERSRRGETRRALHRRRRLLRPPGARRQPDFSARSTSVEMTGGGGGTAAAPPTVIPPPHPSFRPEPRPLGRGGVEKPGGRSVDAAGSGAWPAPVAGRISPLAPLGRNDDWGCASVEMTVGCCASLESAARNRCPSPVIPTPIRHFDRSHGPWAGAEWRNPEGALSTPQAPASARRPSPAGFLRSLRSVEMTVGCCASVESAERPPLSQPSFRPLTRHFDRSAVRRGVEKPGRRSVDVQGSVAWPASVGRNDGKGARSGRSDGEGVRRPA